MVGTSASSIRSRVVDDRAGPDGEAEPAVVGVAQLVGDRLVEDRRVEGLEQVVLGGRPQVAGVDGEVDVGLGVLALGGDPLAQLGVVAGEELDVDPRLVGLLLEGGLDAVVAAGVDGQLLAVVAAAAGDDDGGCREHAQRTPRDGRAWDVVRFIK